MSLLFLDCTSFKREEIQFSMVQVPRTCFFYLFRYFTFTLLLHIFKIKLFQSSRQILQWWYAVSNRLHKMVINGEFLKKWFKWQGACSGKVTRTGPWGTPKFIPIECWGSIITVCMRYWRYDLNNSKAGCIARSYKRFVISTLTFSIWIFPFSSVICRPL